MKKVKPEWPCPECMSEMGHKMSCITGAERRKAVVKQWINLDALMSACEFCGRVVLAGVCCNKALEKSKQEVEKNDVIDARKRGK